MINNKKGLSTVITTLIIILLVLVAIGIIWVVVRGIVEDTTKATDYAVECLKVDVRATSVACSGSPTGDVCNVTLARSAGGNTIAGVKMVFHNLTSQRSSAVLDSRINANPVLNVGDIAPLTTKTAYLMSTGVNGTNRVDVTVYYLDDTGADQLCNQVNPRSY